jgi:putative flippase GtrA
MSLGGQLIRYVINGLVATLIHYSVLRFNIEVAKLPSAGIANAIAAIFGITVSFVGSRYFVFKATQGDLLRQGAVFLLTYACVAALHGLILYVWTDRYGLNYSIGFLLATGMQMSCSFFANKFMVFR